MSDAMPEPEVGLRQVVDKAADLQRDAFFSSGWWHSIDLGDGRVTPGVHKLEELQDNYSRFGLPDDLRGKRVLDIGCWDGFYSFESERRGAEVVSVDCWRPENFFRAHEALGSRIKFHELSVYEVSRDLLGTFDIVLFLGVLYHLRHPLLALDRICEMTRGIAVVESHVIDNLRQTPDPVMEFYELHELGGQYDNWWGPNTTCMSAMLRSAGFVRTEVLRRDPARSVVKAYRYWETPRSEPSSALVIRAITNAVSGNQTYPHRGRYAYLSLWIDGLPEGLGVDDVRIELGELGARPYFLAPFFEGDGTRRTQINVAMPPGIDAGTLPVRISYKELTSREFTIELTPAGEW